MNRENEKLIIRLLKEAVDSPSKYKQAVDAIRDTVNIYDLVDAIAYTFPLKEFQPVFQILKEAYTDNSGSSSRRIPYKLEEMAQEFLKSEYQYGTELGWYIYDLYYNRS